MACRARRAGGTGPGLADPMGRHPRRAAPGNLIWSCAGLRIIDRDTVALAPCERDVWMLGASPSALGRYRWLTGAAPTPSALRFFSLAWTLSDIASFTRMSRSPHEESRWLAAKWGGYERLLDGEPSAPYGSP